MKALVRILRNRVAWVGIALLLGSIGVKLSPEAQQAIQAIGPAIADELSKGEDER